MKQQDLKIRTKQFALRIIRLVSALPSDRICYVLGNQLLKSGTSIGANYREATRASSKRQFVSMLEIAQREAEETTYWLELLADSDTIKRTRLQALQNECRELTAILTSSIRTAKTKAQVSE